MIRFFSLLLFCWCATAQDVEITPQPPTTPEGLKRGERLFQAYCAYCHGPTGGGGRGAILAKPQLRHAKDDAGVFKVIAQGIPGTEMPPNDLSPRQTWELVSYVRSLARVAPATISGDAQRGKSLYETKGGCTSCHTISGRGGAIGPDLTEIGASKGLDFLRTALVDPAADVPPGFLQVRLETKTGDRIVGVRVNEDAFSIQIRDLAGNFRSFWKDELVALHKDIGVTPMPSYQKTFTPRELDDVLAYLASLPGDQ